MSSIFNYIKKNTERRTAGPGSLEKRSARSIERRTEASEKRSVAIEKRSSSGPGLERRSEFRSKPERRSVDLRSWFGSVLDLEDAVIIKPIRGGPALFRMLYSSFRRNVSFKVLKIEFAKGRSFYVFPANVFERLNIVLEGYYQGRNIVMYVEKGSIAVLEKYVEELNVEVREEKEHGPWGEWVTTKIIVNGKQMIPGPEPERRSELQDW